MTVTVRTTNDNDADTSSVLHMVYLVDVQGNWATFDVVPEKNKNKFYLRSAARAANFGKAGHTDYACLYFNGCADSLDITGDFWRFINATLTISTFIDITNRHGFEFVDEFRYAFAQTANDEDALLLWDQAVSKADAEMLDDELSPA